MYIALAENIGHNHFDRHYFGLCLLLGDNNNMHVFCTIKFRNVDIWQTV